MVEAVLEFVWEWVIVFFLFKMVIMRWVANDALVLLKKYTKRTDRMEAIFQHYQLRAFKQGHNADSVLSCREQNCQIFSPTG